MSEQQTPPRSTLGGPQPGETAKVTPPGQSPTSDAAPTPPGPGASKEERDAYDLALAEHLEKLGGTGPRRSAEPESNVPDPSDPELTDEERRRAELGLPRDAPEALVKAAEARLEGDGTEAGEREANQEEVAVLDFLLGPTKALEYDVDALVDTPDGPGVLTFHFKQIRDKRIEELEAEHTVGEGPYAQVNRVDLNAAKVAEAVVYLKDRTGKITMLASEEFLGQGIGDPFDAVKGRFQYQPGIIDRVAAEIDAAAGMSNNRVGFARVAPAAEEAMTTAVGNS